MRFCDWVSGFGVVFISSCTMESVSVVGAFSDGIVIPFFAPWAHCDYCRGETWAFRPAMVSAERQKLIQIAREGGDRPNSERIGAEGADFQMPTRNKADLLRHGKEGRGDGTSLTCLRRGVTFVADPEKRREVRPIPLSDCAGAAVSINA